MNAEMKKLGREIDLGDNIKLIYKEPEVFSRYHAVYHGHKYSQYYFRSSPAEVLEKAKYIDSGYFILKGNSIVGGVFIKPNFMTDLFVVPPYNDYSYLVIKLLKFIKTISDKEKKILIPEVAEDYLTIYESIGCAISDDGFWMIRPTEKMNPVVPYDYEIKDVLAENKYEIADVILAAYKTNPAFKSIDSREDYAEHVERSIEYVKDNTALHNSSKVMVYKPTNEIVGSCLHMEFEALPLIISFAVRPDHQGKGVGSYLLKNSISCSSTDYKATRLYVFNNNPAIKIYEHMGFIRNRKLNDMYLINE